MVREVGRNGFLQKVSTCLCRDGSDLTVPDFIPLPPLPLISSISVSYIKDKSNLRLSNNLHLKMFGRGRRTGAINIWDAQWSMKSCIHGGHMGKNIKIKEVSGWI